MTQKEKIVKYLKEHGSITQYDAIRLGCLRLSARIFELKDDYIIRPGTKKVKDADGSYSMVGIYYYVGEKEKNEE